MKKKPTNKNPRKTVKNMTVEEVFLSERRMLISLAESKGVDYGWVLKAYKGDLASQNYILRGLVNF